MPTITPVWTDDLSVVSLASLARGSVTRQTLDLRTKVGAYLYARIGRTGTTALTNGVDVRINRTLDNGAIRHPASVVPLVSSVVAMNGNTTVNSDSASGQDILNVAATTNFAAGDFIVIRDGDDSGVTRVEFARVAALLSSPARLQLDGPLRYTHTSAQADKVRNKADLFAPVWVMGGALIEVIFDYADDAAGEAVIVECRAQTYDNDLSA